MKPDDVPRRIVGIVYGSCPMGCGQTLQVDTLGTVSCYAAHCPRPDAVAVILANPETEHVVAVKEFGYTIMHPLRERVHGDLFECSIHAAVSDEVDERAGEPGHYRVKWTVDGELEWEFLEGPADGE